MTLVFRGGQFSHVACNVCDTPAPSRQQMAHSNAHGITGMGWVVPREGGIHLCPEHSAAKVEPQGPRYEDAQ